MDITKAQRLARELMDAHGFGHLRFVWSRRKAALGVCRYVRSGFGTVKPVSIELSKYWVPHLSEAEVRDTILHELAHAMTPGDHHGAAWKAACRRIGANPTRLAESVPREIVNRVGSLHARYRFDCENCGTLGYAHRMTRKRQVSTFTCKACRGDVRIAVNS